MLIVVTGFGPFRGHEVNPSWEAVKGLPAIWEEGEHKLLVEEIPVEYDFVLKEVPDRWSSHSPDFIVHVGVSHLAEKLTLETRANNTGYSSPDVKASCPPNNCCVPAFQQEKLDTCLDLQDLCHQVTVQARDQGVEADVSEDAGKYLCDFVYFKSLHATSGKSLFVHVPMIGKPYTVDQMTTGLKIVIKNIIKQLQCQATQ